jgi:hypothetical protein
MRLRIGRIAELFGLKIRLTGNDLCVRTGLRQGGLEYFHEQKKQK